MTINNPPAHKDAPKPPAATAEQQEAADALISDGFGGMNIEDEPTGEAPPPYGELPDKLQFSQAGFEAGAAVTSMPSCPVCCSSSKVSLTM
jgi:hypothetical protein